MNVLIDSRLAGGVAMKVMVDCMQMKPAEDPAEYDFRVPFEMTACADLLSRF